MALCYHESFRQIDELCRQLNILVETARSSEVQGAGGILAYRWIRDCASRIEMMAENRRQMLAQAQLENTLGEEIKRLDVLDVRMAS